MKKINWKKFWRKAVTILGSSALIGATIGAAVASLPFH